MSKRNRRQHKGTPRAVYASTGGGNLLLCAPGALGVDTEQRTIAGLIVPFGKPGETSGGRLTFAAGSLGWSDVKRVKLLREHDQRDVLGYATDLTETPDGIRGTFHVPEGENGDRALAEAANGLRDAFSVGVQLDDATVMKLRRTQAGGSVAARGVLREVSQVSVPAFDDARVAAATGADLVVSSWAATTLTTSAAGAGSTNGGNAMFTKAQRRRLSHLLALSSLTDEQLAERDNLQALATAASVTVTAALDPDEAAPAEAGEQTVTASTPVTTASGPTTVPAVAGAAVVTAEPSPYTFATGSAGLVADLYAGATRHDSEAAERVAKFNAQLRDGNAPTLQALVTAAATRTDVDGAGTDLPDTWGGGVQSRPDLMRQLIDARRPFLSRLNAMPLKNAQPFAIPTVGEFDGVGDHTEGQPHRAAGTLTLGSGDVVQPKSVSGAWEVSRELLDAANPLLDRIAVRAMFNDYARKTEADHLALYTALAAVAGHAPIASVDHLMELRGELLDFVNDNEEGADLLALGKTAARLYLTEVDAADRAQIPFVQPSNALATRKAGSIGFTIDDVEAFRSARLDADVLAGIGVMARTAGLYHGESKVQQFRFDEVLGPGVVKFALWGYTADAILDTADVQLFKTGA